MDAVKNLLVLLRLAQAVVPKKSGKASLDWERNLFRAV
jgi:hypothetical protein